VPSVHPRSRGLPLSAAGRVQRPRAKTRLRLRRCRGRYVTSCWEQWRHTILSQYHTEHGRSSHDALIHLGATRAGGEDNVPEPLQFYGEGSRATSRDRSVVPPRNRKLQPTNGLVLEQEAQTSRSTSTRIPMKDGLGDIRDARHILDNQRREQQKVEQPRERRHECSPRPPRPGPRAFRREIRKAQSPPKGMWKSPRGGE
jgi:hypothetical protein